MRRQIPSVGDVYERWDGETVTVCGLVLDDDGDYCVEYETRDEALITPLSKWLGVHRDAGFPPPRRFVCVDELGPEEPLLMDPGKPDDIKLAIISKVREISEATGDGGPVSIGTVEPEE